MYIMTCLMTYVDTEIHTTTYIRYKVRIRTHVTCVWYKYTRSQSNYLVMNTYKPIIVLPCQPTTYDIQRCTYVTCDCYVLTYTTNMELGVQIGFSLDMYLRIWNQVDGCVLHVLTYMEYCIQRQ